MPAHRIWPGTPAERQDRSRVIELVQHVGRRRLRFSVYDLHRAMVDEPRLRLAKSAALSRHVHDLSRDLLRPAGRRLAAADADRETGEVLSAPHLARHTWVLTERWPEYEQAPPELDDLERTLHALWVAYVASDREPVPTRAVTDVMRTLEALAPDREQQTSLRLQTLAERADRLAERLPGASDRWVRWRPAGPEPAHPDFAAWVSAMREKNSCVGAVGVGHATLNEAVRELVVIAVRASRTADWPSGRPVLIEDIRAQVELSARAMALMHRIERSGRSLHEVLSDAARTRIAGAPRARARIVRCLRRIGERCYYDVPDEPGTEHRQMYLLQEDLRTCTYPSQLEAIGREWAAAQRLAKSDDLIIRAIAAVRALSCWDEAGEIEAVMEELQQRRSRLSERAREWIAARMAGYEALVGRWGSRTDAEEAAAAALAPFGSAPEEVLAVPRPLLAPTQLREFVPAIRHGKGSASDFFARLPALRRFPNPAYTDKRDPDPLRAAITCADRPEGMIYLAEQSGARTLAFLRRGGTLLGRSLRCPKLFRQLARSAVPEDRFAGLAALALLGDAEGVEIALEWLRDPALPVVEVECALYALLVLRQVNPDEWPAHVRSSKASAMQRLWREVVLAARQGRWLMQR